MPRLSPRPNLSHLLPLSGVGELESAVKGLINTLKASGYEKERCESLVTHLENLLDVVRPVCGLEGFTELPGQLSDLKDRVQAVLKHKSRMDFLGAQNRLELLDKLNQEIEQMLMRSLLKLAAQSNHLLVTQNRRSAIENFKTIPSHEITFQEEPRSASRPLALHEPHLECFGDMEGGEGNHVIVSQQTGRYGTLPIIYKTYNSRSGSAAAEQAEVELKTYSKFLHKNVANVVGVTKGYYGLSGIVLHLGAKAGLPPEEFLSRPISGAALVRYIRGVHSVIHFLWHQDGGRVGSITTQSNGHITVVPSTGGKNAVALSPFDLLRIPQEANPGLRLVLDLQFEGTTSVYRHGGPVSLEAQEFLDKLTKLSLISFSELSVLKTASDLGLSPSYEGQEFIAAAPSFTLFPGDIGRLVKHEGLLISWESLHNGGRFATQELLPKLWDYYPTDTCDDRCKWRSCPITSTEFSTWTTHCTHEFHDVVVNYRDNTLKWKDIMQKSRHISNMHHVDIKKLSFCKSVDFNIRVVSRGVRHQGPFYFHINPLQQLNPQEFWGFLSSSSDPHSSSARLEALGWTFDYDITAWFYDIKDDFGLRYEGALSEGLANMPGGYPGGRVEEVSDEELSDDGAE